ARSDAVAARWAEGPVHRRFAEAMRALPAPRAEAVADAIRTIFADDGWVDALVATLARAMREDPFFAVPFRHINSDVHTGVIVYEDDKVSIAAGVSQAPLLAAKKNRARGSLSVAFSGQVSVMKFVKGGRARLSFWEIDPITADFTAAGAGTCRSTGERLIADGDILTVDGRSQSFVIEHAASNLLVLQATVKPDQAPLSVEYDAHTRAYVGCSAADDSASRIQMITTLLRKLGAERAFPAMAEFVEHPNFFVRWHVMRELLGLDAVAALPHLKRMAARDPHPETRRCARIVLDRLEAGALTCQRAA
nr:HEAT repeat domain-containing protein [Pseudomonadota bacterium]